MSRPAKGTPTSLNLWVLRKLFAAGRTELANALEVTDLPHMRRCMQAGLVVPAVVEGARVLRLTPAGVLARDAEQAKQDAIAARWAKEQSS